MDSIGSAEVVRAGDGRWYSVGIVRSLLATRISLLERDENVRRQLETRLHDDERQYYVIEVSTEMLIEALAPGRPLQSARDVFSLLAAPVE